MPDDTPVTPLTLPGYENPPLSELAVGVQFASLSGWQTRHVGEFWVEVAKEFPHTEDQIPIFDVQVVPGFEVLKLPPLRRTFLISQDQNFLIQLQDSRFVVNWRKTKPSDVYPRFKTIFKKFVTHWGHFSDFVARERVGNLAPTRYELTYVNHIEQADDSVGGTAERYVRLFDWGNLKAQFLAPPTGVNVVWTFAMPDQLGFAQANLSQGVRPDGRKALVLVMSCTGTASPKVSLNDWFDAAHRWLGLAFRELTTNAAREEWRYKE